MADPLMAVHRFCKLYDLPALRADLWNWLSEMLSSAETSFDDAGRRADLLLLYEKLQGLLEAVYLINEQQYEQCALKSGLWEASLPSAYAGAGSLIFAPGGIANPSKFPKLPLSSHQSITYL